MVKKIIRSDLFVFVVFFIIAFLTFRYGLIEVPHRDHPAYMRERGYTESDWQWFWHSVSYNRVRVNYAGDYMLFRPAHMAFLALQDIFLRRYLLTQGIIAIAVCSFAAYSIYAVGKLFTARWLGIIFAILFLVQYAGIEAVVWRHITPYILSLSFLSFGLIFWVRSTFKQTRTNRGLFIFLNFLSTLFHEFALLALVAMGIVLLISNSIIKKRRSRLVVDIRTILIIFFLPVVASFTLNIIDFIYYKTQYFFGPSDVLARKINISSLISSLYYVLSSISTAFLFPSAVELKEHILGDIPQHTLSWDFFKTSSLILIISSIIISIFCLTVFMSAIRDYLRGHQVYLNVILVLFLVLLCIFVLGIGLGRIFLREEGFHYLFTATYYYQMTGFVLSGLFLVSLVKIKEKTQTGLQRKIFYIVITAIVSLLVLINYFKIQKTLMPLYPKKKEYVKSMNLVANQFEKNRQYCLAGYVPITKEVMLYMTHAQDFFLLWDYFCARDDKRTPLYVTGNPDGNLWLAELQTTNFELYEPHYVKLKHYNSGSGEFLVSEGIYKKCDFEVTMDAITDKKYPSYIMFGYENKGNYLQFGIDAIIAYGRIKKNGSFPENANRNVILPKDLRRMRLRVYYSGKDVYLFKDRYLLTAIFDAPIKEGKISIFLPRNYFMKLQTLPELKVASDCNNNDEKRSIRLIPKFELDVFQSD